nr:unnamed protein product [Callosobruchus chinensis]
MESFKAEIQQIKSKKLSPKHELCSLNPFIDNSGYLRVGGRLAYANFDFEKKHPLILSKDHSISKLLVRHYHIKLFNTGPEHILANLRDKYWIIAGRYLTRKISPHMGGIWEIGIKSMKAHMKRVIVNTHLTFEHFYTLLVEIESVMNSRPLSPLSSSPHDLSPLTPSHFLLGCQSNFIPSEDVRDIAVNRLNVYKHLQKMKHHIWDRWSKEYISQLQQRYKWKTSRGAEVLKEGVSVLVKDDNLPPMNWRLGRIVSAHSGSDGVNRVFSVKTQQGLIKRSFSKLCPLLTEL